MNEMINTNSELRDQIFVSYADIATEMDEWCEKLREAAIAHQDAEEASWDRFMAWVDAM